MYQRNKTLCILLVTLFVTHAFLGSIAKAETTINLTTDRYVRNLYGCYLSTNDNVKPQFSDAENAWVDSTNLGFADLNGDRIPELITGYRHESHPSGKPYSRNKFQYGFYSTNKNFIAPSGTKFLMARTIITQDFNGDSKDDVVFVQHGPDFAPYVLSRNEILLSSPIGYKTKYLPGGQSHYHGGAAGDFDNDGDIDIVATPGFKNELVLLLNNGKGNFTPRFIRNVGRNYNIKTWDIDHDGNLDLFIDGHKEPLRVLWGMGNGKFSQPETIPGNDRHDLMQDITFYGHDAYVLSSLKAYGEMPPYSGFSINKLTFNGRNVIKTEAIDSLSTPGARSPDLWLPHFHLCDLNDNGEVDLIFEMFGESTSYANQVKRWINLDRIIWYNENGKFTRHTIAPLNHHLLPSGIFPKDDHNQKAASLGVSTRKYIPAQTYAQITPRYKFATRHSQIIARIKENPMLEFSRCKSTPCKGVEPDQDTIKLKKMKTICKLAVKNGEWVNLIGLKSFVDEGKALGMQPKDCSK